MTRRELHPRRLLALTAFFLSISQVYACGESREDKMRRAVQNAMGDPAKRPDVNAAQVPPDPTRDAMAPVLKALYSGERLPAVLSGDVEQGQKYSVSPGILSKITVKTGLSEHDKAQAIVRATAEADAWVHRPRARKTYADHIHKVFRSFGAEQRVAIMQAYAELKLLDFFNRSDSDALVANLPAHVKPAVDQMKQHYRSAQDEVWDKWMSVKMYARREVSTDQPFRPLLSSLQKKLGKEEPAPLTWDKSHDKPFRGWAAQIKGNKDLFSRLSNLKEYRDQVEMQGDTHTIWAMQGSPMIPAKARSIEIDRRLGFGVHREDLGGGYQEITFVFPKKLRGNKLKQAYLRSHVYRHIFSDFQLLATAGSDFEGGQVPDKYDAAYAFCASQAAMDSMITNFSSKYPIFRGLKASARGSDKILARAHKCIIKMGAPDIKNPPKDDEMAPEGPAPGSRLGFFQMLARFENPAVNLANMRKKEAKSQAELDAAAFLKANPNQQ